MKRKKKFLALGLAAVMLLSSITIAFAVTTADNVKTEGFEIPDKALVQALIDNGADANEDGTITVAEMEGLTWLSSDWYEDCGRKPIKNLSGIEVAKNLRSLSLENNVIEDITPLKSLKELEWVYLDGNPLSGDACKELQEAIIRPIVLLEGQSFSFLLYSEGGYFSTPVIYSEHYGTVGRAEDVRSDSPILDVEIFYPNGDGDDDVIYRGGGGVLREYRGHAKKVGDCTVSVDIGRTDDGYGYEYYITIPVHVVAVPTALETVTKTLPALSDIGQLILSNQDGTPNMMESVEAWEKWGEGATALYPNGELYYIGNHSEIKLADNVKNYIAVDTGCYVGDSIYWNQFNILDYENTLWKWSWQEGSEQPKTEKIAEHITDFGAGLAIDADRNLLDIHGNKNITVMKNVAQIDGIDYALRIDGTVWKNVYGTDWNSAYGSSSPYSYQFIKLYDNVHKLIGNGYYVKQDGSTWHESEKIADFSATSVQTGTSFTDDENSIYYYVAVKEDGSVWKINMDNLTECTKIADHFSHWSTEWNSNYSPYRSFRTVGFYTTDDVYYSLRPLERSVGSLHNDKSLWCHPSYKFLTSVESYAEVKGGTYGSFSEFLAVRSDGSIWGYHFNEASRDVPVMVKAPIDKELTPTLALGDVNLDGKVNTSDARLALRGAATLETLTDQQILAADVNKNGKADTSDARKILRVAANLDQF